MAKILVHRALGQVPRVSRSLLFSLVHGACHLIHQFPSCSAGFCNFFAPSACGSTARSWACLDLTFDALCAGVVPDLVRS